MKAAVVTAFGGPEVIELQDVAEPVPGPGQLTVAVAYVNVLFVEAMIRRGEMRGRIGLEPPYIPGNGVAGLVRGVGEGVDRRRLGTTVVAHTGGGRAAAEQAVVSAGAAVEVPNGIALDRAAAVMHDGVTALALQETLGIASGMPVLVVGASGGLGISSIQLARATGARVVATARGDKLSRVRELGDVAVIDSDGPGWVAEARAALGGRGAQAILDNIGGAVGAAALGAIAPGGRFSAHGTASGGFARLDPQRVDELDVTVLPLGGAPLDEAKRVRYTQAVLGQLAAGRLAPVIGQVYPLARAADAHAAIEARTVFGKTLLQIT